MRGARWAPLFVSTRRKRETELRGKRHAYYTNPHSPANGVVVSSASTFRSRSIVNACQDGSYLLKEIRGATVSYFIEPGSHRVRSEFAIEAIHSGWLAPRDFDLLGEAMSWSYQAKPAPKTSTQFSRPAITAKTTTPR